MLYRRKDIEISCFLTWFFLASQCRFSFEKKKYSTNTNVIYKVFLTQAWSNNIKKLKTKQLKLEKN